MDDATPDADDGKLEDLVSGALSAGPPGNLPPTVTPADDETPGVIPSEESVDDTWAGTEPGEVVVLSSAAGADEELDDEAAEATDADEEADDEAAEAPDADEELEPDDEAAEAHTAAEDLENESDKKPDDPDTDAEVEEEASDDADNDEDRGSDAENAAPDLTGDDDFGDDDFGDADLDDVFPGDPDPDSDVDDFLVVVDDEPEALLLGALQFDEQGALLVADDSEVSQTHADAYELRTSALDDDDTVEPAPAPAVLGGRVVEESAARAAASDETMDLLRSTRVDDEDLVPVQPIVEVGDEKSRSLVSTPFFQFTSLIIGLLACLVLWQWRTAPPDPPRQAASETVSADVSQDELDATAAQVEAGEAAGADGAAADLQPGEPELTGTAALLQPDSPMVAAVTAFGELFTIGSGDSELQQVEFDGAVDPSSVSVTPFGVLFASEDGDLWIWNRSNGAAPTLVAATGEVGVRGQPVADAQFGIAFIDRAGRGWLFNPDEGGLSSLDEGVGGSEEVVVTAEGLALLGDQKVTLIRPNGRRVTLYEVVDRDNGFPVDIEAGAFGLAVLDDVGRVWVRDNRDQNGFVVAFEPAAANAQATQLSAGDTGLAMASTEGIVFWHDAATDDTFALFAPQQRGEGTFVDVGAFGATGRDIAGNGWLFSPEDIENTVLLFQASTRPKAADMASSEFGIAMLDETGDVWIVQSTTGELSGHTLETLNITKAYDAGGTSKMVELVGD